MTTELAALEDLPSEFEERVTEWVITSCPCDYTW